MFLEIGPLSFLNRYSKDMTSYTTLTTLPHPLLAIAIAIIIVVVDLIINCPKVGVVKTIYKMAAGMRDEVTALEHSTLKVRVNFHP